MFKITNRVYIANKNDLQSVVTHRAHVICLSPWQEIIGQTEFEGNLLSLEQNQHVGRGKRVLFELENEEIPHYDVNEFKKIIKLINKYQKEELIVMSTHGQSRAPSFVLLWLAHYARQVSNSSFGAARMDFSRLFPNYVPWPALVIFLNQEWDVLSAND